MKVRKGLSVGVALGGGAARGLAHIGVLKALDEYGIPIDALAGVSVGSVVAAGYASGMTCDQLIEAAHSVTWKDIGSWSFSVRGFSRNDRLGTWLASVLPCSRFEDLQIPLRIVASDLHGGEPVVLEKGDLFQAIRASCAIPGFYVPVEIDGKLLADGYLTCNLPIREVREMGMDVVLSSAIGLEISSDVKLNNLYQILLRSFSIMSASVQRERYQESDVVFRPQVEKYNWADMDSAPALIKAGIDAVQEKRGQLQEAVDPSFWSRVNWNPWRQHRE